MAGYIGEIGKRIKIEVTLVGDYEYTTSYGWQTQDNHIYTMVDDQEHTIVWKTTSLMKMEGYDEKNIWWADFVHKGDKIEITATVKEHSTYKEQEQTEVQRLKVNKFIEKAPTKEEIEANKRQEQIESLKGEDFIWRMPYKQYKEHYSDCETVIGSYEADEHRASTIEVIIREGRLKASGVRGKHFHSYCMQNSKGMKTAYVAVNEENALKRVKKDFPDEEWECVKIYW